MLEGRLEGLEIDPVNEQVRWGSIYWAKVKTIDSALDAVFLDLDGENTGILYNADVRWVDEAGTIHKGGDQAIGKRFRGGSFVAVQAKSAYLPQEQDSFGAPERKIPQMSMDITLPGRYLIFGNMLGENRISQRIRDKALRKQLTDMQNALEDIKGCILRASAAGTQTDMLRREGKILSGAWEDISSYFTGEEPALIALGPNAIQRALSDHASQRIERIEVVTMSHFHEVEDWCAIFAPDLVPKIQPVTLKNATEDLALFHYRDIVGQIESLFQSYATLPHGGNLIIQNTSALTAIDVNKGASKTSHLTLNLAAAKEIARQIRLRNTGGIIVIDFLKSQNKQDEPHVLSALERAVQDDPCTVQIHGFTKLGLLEITRKRRTPALTERISRKALQSALH